MALSLKTAPSDLTRIAARNGGVYPLARLISGSISGEERRFPVDTGRAPYLSGDRSFRRFHGDQDLGSRENSRNLAAFLESLQDALVTVHVVGNHEAAASVPG